MSIKVSIYFTILLFLFDRDYLHDQAPNSKMYIYYLSFARFKKLHHYPGLYKMGFSPLTGVSLVQNVKDLLCKRMVFAKNSNQDVYILSPIPKTAFRLIQPHTQI